MQSSVLRFSVGTESIKPCYQLKHPKAPILLENKGTEAGGAGEARVALRSQVTREEPSAGERGHERKAGPPPDAFPGPAVLTAAERLPWPVGREKKDPVLGFLCPDTGFPQLRGLAHFLEEGTSQRWFKGSAVEATQTSQAQRNNYS